MTYSTKERPRMGIIGDTLPLGHHLIILGEPVIVDCYTNGVEKHMKME